MFPCTACGLCCQNISTVDELKKFDLGNGTCKHYNIIDNNCKIYDTRPDICRIDKMYEIKYNNYFTKKDFYIENAKVCNQLQEKHRLDNSFRIILGE
jgi:Fe-S-cluster containining protein